MDKQRALELLKLLSAIESWSYSVNVRMPDYLNEHLCDSIEYLTEEVLK